MDRRRAGFTLLELMIVVTVMGTMAAMMAPGIGEFLADARASAASEDLIRLSRHMRSRVQQTGLAHLLIFSGIDADSGGLGRVVVYEGMNNHCRQTPWGDAITGTIANGHTIVDRVDLGDSSYNSPTGSSPPTKDDTNRQVIALSVRGSLGAADSAAVICYEPGGGTLEGVSDASSASFAFSAQTQPITFVVTRSVSGVRHGANREVVFPAGGAARFRF
jgi:prepilin-type N-terminal cleavage/methylation domain-containing protein